MLSKVVVQSAYNKIMKMKFFVAMIPFVLLIVSALFNTNSLFSNVYNIDSEFNKIECRNK